MEQLAQDVQHEGTHLILAIVYLQVLKDML